MPDVLSKLDYLKKYSLVVADTGDWASVDRFAAEDCTTNPTLVFKSVQADPQAEYVQKALEWGRKTGAGALEIAQKITINLASLLTTRVPGRVSLEVEANLSFDTQAMVQAARTYIQHFESHGISRQRILIKIATTWEGIQAAHILQGEGIDCNMTLVFSLVQAMACAKVGAFLISPFVGRILDWYQNKEGRTYAADEDPGVLSVREIYAHFKAQKLKTIVMAASFRNLGQIEALAGCDRLTISPSFLEELAQDRRPLARALTSELSPTTPVPLEVLNENFFRWQMNENAMASEKLGEGIRIFARDLKALQVLVASLM